MAGRGGKPLRGWWAWLHLALLGLVLAGTMGVILLMPILPGGLVRLEEGDIAPRDIRAPRPLTYESAILRSEAQARAEAQVAPIYSSPDPAIARQQLDRARQVLDYLGSVRADPLATPAQRRAWVLAVPELDDLPTAVLDPLFALADESWDRVQWETQDVIDQAMRREIREGHLDEARQGVLSLVGLDLTAEEAAITDALAQRFLVPNAFYDAEATMQARAAARDGVGPVLRTFKANQIVVREGDSVKPLDLEALDQLGLRQPCAGWTDLVSTGLLATLGTLLLGLYLWCFRVETLWNGRELVLLVLLIIISTLGAKVLIPGRSVLSYLFPAPALAMLVTAVLGPQVGVATALLVAIVSGTVGGGSLEMAIYIAAGGLVAALTLGRVERLGALFRTGALVALAHVAVILIYRLPQDAAEPLDVLLLAAAGAANGELSASLALGGLFVVGPLFDIATTVRLMELNRPDQPLLQRLLREAPGTYHHSLMVANLAEQAAERIGADALLTRVGAFYHDVGKITHPYFFVENQVEGMNPHDRLDPTTSAEVIVHHAHDGLELARRYRLPSRVRAFIPEHHGTTRASFFYKLAVEQAGDPALVNEADFRYRGPQPQSRETALVLLADGCESATRADRPRSREEVAEIVNRIIAARVADGQLDECDLTLHDLHLVRQTFIAALKGVYHPRIQYPQAETEATG